MRSFTPGRFYSHVVDGRNGCLLWTGKIGRNGYGHFTYREDGHNITALVHRFAWEQKKGPIPPGLTIDHLCRVPLCVNTEHMETVDMRTNTLRGTSPIAQNARKEVCLNGHPLEGVNLYLRRDGSRNCVACMRQRTRNWRARQHAL